MSWRRITSVLGLLAVAAVSTAGADDYIRMTLVDPAPTPFSTVRYEVSRRGPATLAVHRRQLPGYGEPLHEMGLMTPEEADALWRTVAELGSCVLESASPAGGSDEATASARPAKGSRNRSKKEAASPTLAGPAWEIELSVDGRRNHFTVADPANQPDRRYATLVRTVRQSVHAITGELPFRNVFIDSDAMGYINIVSVPVARVTIDGFDTQLETPLYGYELSGGSHQVRLGSTDGRFERQYEVRVEAGGTTRLRVDLR